MKIFNQDGNSNFNFSLDQLGKGIRVAVIVCLGVLTLFILVHTISAIRAYPLIGEESLGGEAQNAISVSGHADMDVSPDVTVFSWSTDSEGKTVEEAQSKSATLNNKAIAFLKSKGIADSDIKTTGYNTETKYDTQYRPCGISGKGMMTTNAPSYVMPPCTSESVPTGFTTYQSVEVKVRNIDKQPSKPGELIAGLGAIGVKASNPVSTIDNPDSFRNAVRGQAIAKAREQAEVLAHDLGVKIVRVTSFNEDGSPHYPGIYAQGMMAKSQDSAPVVPEISAGTNKISSDVTITYQIR